MAMINPANSNAINMAFQKFDKSNASETSLVKNAVDAKTSKTEVAANVSIMKAQDKNLGTIIDMKA